MAKNERTNTTSVETEAAEAIYDPMKDMVTVYLSRATGNEADSEFVALNGKGYTVKRGVSVRLPRPVADILEDAERQKERKAAFIAEQEAKARDAELKLWR